MAGIYKIFFISTFLVAASVVAQDYSVGKKYFYRFPEKQLYRAQMNVSNEWLSAELFSEDDKRKIVFFKHGAESDKYIELTKKKAKKVENFVFDARLLIWSSDSSKIKRNMFSFIHYKAKKDEYQFLHGSFDDDPTKLTLHGLKISGLISKRVVDYSRMHYNEEDRFLAVIADYNNDKSIQFVGEGIVGITELIIPNLSEIATEIYMHNSRKVLLTVRDEINYSDVFYFRDFTQIYKESERVKIFADSSLDGHQMYPSFNFTDDFIAFIDVDSAEDEALMRLYMCPTPKFNKKIGKLIPIEAKDYIMADDNLRTVEHMELPSEMAMDYSWHPKSNTLFYVKGEKRRGSLDIDRNIWYYNVESRERRMLETNTTWNYSISFSPDGKYILFSTLGLEHGNNHFSNCSYKNSPDNSQCCNDGLSRIICVAELIRNE